MKKDTRSVIGSLSATQRRAYKKLTDKWQCPAEMEEQQRTFDTLVKMKLAKVRYLPNRIGGNRFIYDYKRSDSDEDI